MTINSINSKWFLAANNSGAWILTEGIANIQIDGNAFNAHLFFSSDSPEYLRLIGEIEDECLEVEGISPDIDVPTIYLSGAISTDVIAGISVMLSDGWTTIGLAAKRGKL
ncbi:MAG: hypothetical protein V4805_13800 [Pseudomonadota bacterium]